MPLAVTDREIPCLLLYDAESKTSKLTGRMPLPLLCIGNRFLFEHQLEWLSDEGFKDLRLSLADRPRETEAVVGGGARWGVSVRYTMDPEHAALGERLQKHPCRASKGVLLVDGDALLRFPIPRDLNQSLAFENGSGPLPILYLIQEDWTKLLGAPCPGNLAELCLAIKEILPQIGKVRVDAFYRPVHDIETFQQVNRSIRECDEGFQFKGFERAPNVRVGRMTHISSRADLRAPCLIGDGVVIRGNAIIGPGAFIGDRSFVESGAHIHESVVAPGTYIGPNTSFEGQYVCRNYTLDLERGTAIFVDDPMILGDLARPMVWSRGAMRLVAGFSLVLAFPLLLLLLPIHRLLRGRWMISQWMLLQPVKKNLLGEFDFQWRRWQRFDFGWFGLDFLPSLWSVARGRLSFVGNPPMDKREVEAIEAVWRDELLSAKVGLTGPVQQLKPRNSTADDIFATSIYYNATRTLKEDALLFLKALAPGRHRFKRISP